MQFSGKQGFYRSISNRNRFTPTKIVSKHIEPWRASNKDRIVHHQTIRYFRILHLIVSNSFEFFICDPTVLLSFKAAQPSPLLSISPELVVAVASPIGGFSLCLILQWVTSSGLSPLFLIIDRHIWANTAWNEEIFRSTSEPATLLLAFALSSDMCLLVNRNIIFCRSANDKNNLNRWWYNKPATGRQRRKCFQVKTGRAILSPYLKKNSKRKFRQQPNG